MLYRRVMSARARISAVVLATVSALALGGCVPSELDPISSPEPTATPVFASEEEALAAATDAYAAYQAAADAIFADGGNDPSRIENVAIGAARDAALASFQSFRESGYRSVGRTAFDRASVQQYSPGSTTGFMSMYLCLRLGAVDVLDASGQSVVSADRPDAQAYVVTFDLTDNSGGAVVSEREAWAGAGVCVD